jgi:hypothetical protein
MGSPPVNRSAVGSRVVRRVTAGVAAILLAAVAAPRAGAGLFGGSGHKIEIDRQIWLGGIEGSATAMAKIPGGGFVVAGYQSTGWAVATDAQGTILWNYVAPLDESLTLASPGFSHSEFHGVVPLRDGNILLCGEKYVDVHKTVAWITILSKTGQLIEERNEFKNGDEDYTSSSIDHCIQWNDDVVLTGNTKARTARGMARWIMKLDGRGAKQWERVFTAENLLFNPAVSADRDLVTVQIARNPNGTSINTLRKLNEKGEIVASSAPMRGEYQYVMRSVGHDKGIAIIDSIQLRNRYDLYALGDRLEQIGESRQLRGINLQEGFGFRLPDQSLVLFGSTSTQYGGRGAIQWVANNGEEIAIVVFRQILNGVTFGDATPLASNQFVVVASQNAYASRTHGLFMSWITLH